MRLRSLLLAALLSGCVSARPTPTPHPGARSVARLCAGERSERWVDCALAHMSLREKAAQMVWPQIYGDFVPADAASWRRASSLVTEQKVGGFIMSVGSPLEIAAKLNA